VNLLCLLLITALSAKGDFARIRVIWTSDLHAQLLPTTDFSSAGLPRRQLGGMSGLIKLITELKTPDCLLLDVGDFAFGSPEGDSSQGRVMTYFMNRLGYHAAVPGAHDFQDGLVNLELLARAAGFPLLADPMLNILLKRQSTLFRPVLVREVAGVRVGIVGVLDPELRKINPQLALSGLLSEEPLVQARRLLPAVTAESAEIIIVAGHISAAAGRLIAESLPAVDLVICRGEPVIVGELPSSGNAGVVLSGVYGQRVGVAEILFHKTERKVYAIEAQMVNVQPEPEPAPEVRQFILADYDRAACFSGMEFFPDAVGRWKLALTIAEALRTTSGADLAIVPPDVIEAGIAAGPLTRRDLFNSVPFRERLRMLIVPESLLNLLIKPPSLPETTPLPAIAGADLFVVSDTLSLPDFSRFAGIRLRERKNGLYKVIIPENWLAQTGIQEKGKLLPDNLTRFWLRFAENAGKLTAIPVPRLYPATLVQAQQLQQTTTGLININTADEKLLCQLPGIGQKTAQRIIEYRQTHGRFNSIEEIMNVRGIGPKKFERLKNLITVR
jgi:comEA protein